MQRYKPYKKTAGYSYTVGLFPTLKLLESRSEIVEEIFVNDAAYKSPAIRKIQTLCRAKDIALSKDNATVERLGKAGNAFVIGVFRKFEQQLDARQPHIVLVNPDDMGNVGTILRTMAGFDQHNLAVITPAADIFDPRVVRASMGALFQQSFAHFDSIDTYCTTFPEHRLYPFMLEGATELANTTFGGPYSLVFGNEGSGLPENYLELGTPIRIEQTGGIDSLNLAIAASLGMYRAFTN